jgi:hypothetical protein
MKCELTNKSADYLTKQFQLQNSYTVETDGEVIKNKDHTRI